MDIETSFIRSRPKQTMQNTAKQNYPGLVASYDIQGGHISVSHITYTVLAGT